MIPDVYDCKLSILCMILYRVGGVNGNCNNNWQIQEINEHVNWVWIRCRFMQRVNVSLSQNAACRCRLLNVTCIIT